MAAIERSLMLSAEALRKLQQEKFAAMIREVFPSNVFYTEKFRAAGLMSADEIAAPENFRKLPFTLKTEIAGDQECHPPYGTNLTYPVVRYNRLHQSSGTKGGRPLRWLDTKESWDWVLGLWKEIYAVVGIRDEDRFFFPFSFGPFLGFWAGFESASRRGNLTIAGGGMTTQARLKVLLDNGVTIICCTPTYALHMAESAREMGLDLLNSPVRMLIVAGEPGGNIPETKRRIEEAWGAKCIDHSGMTEIGSLGIECLENPGGLHLIETECIAEIIDPTTGNPVPRGQRGELVLTNLGRWGSPLIRYRTGDLVEADAEPCPCGRSLVRLKGGILGRADDMVLIRGNNVYPGAIEAILRRFPEVQEYRAEVSMSEGMAVLSLEIESDASLDSNGGGMVERIASAVKDALNFRPRVKIVGAGTLPRYEMKAARFVIHPSYRKEMP